MELAEVWEKAELQSGCKINLSLDITGKRPDGYHTLSSFFVPLSNPYDRLIVYPRKENGRPVCSVSCSDSGIDLQNNTLTKAFKLFSTASPHCPGLKVELFKFVPQGAGLGGGSANAAALLLYLNSFVLQQGLPGLNSHELNSLAARVGADVPFFLLNRPAWVSGIGEVIKVDDKPLAVYKNSWLVLVCPEIKVSTRWAFNEFDKMHNDASNGLTSKWCQDSNNSAEAISFINKLEVPVFAAFPKLKELKEKLFELGAFKAMMSGSGSSIFGLFAAQGAAMKASEAFRTDGLSVYTQVL